MSPLFTVIALIGGILIGVFVPHPWPLVIAAVAFVAAVVLAAVRRPA
jgi:glucose uptake protein GlcU